MKTEQEQIKAIKQIIDERVETTLGYVQGRHGNVIKTVDTIIIARDIVEAGYGDIRQAQIDALTKLKDSYGLYYLSAFGVKERMLADILNPMIEELKK